MCAFTYNPITDFNYPLIYKSMKTLPPQFDHSQCTTPTYKFNLSRCSLLLLYWPAITLALTNKQMQSTDYLNKKAQ